MITRIRYKCREPCRKIPLNPSSLSLSLSLYRFVSNECHLMNSKNATTTRKYERKENGWGK